MNSSSESDGEDRREAILVRIKEVLATYVPTNHAFRNRLRIPDELLKEGPVAVVLDGDETPDDTAYGRGRPATTPVIVTMTPEIYTFVADAADVVGTSVNTLRGKIIKGVLTDETLVALCHNGDIRYQGFMTGFAFGRSLEGEAGLSFAFQYVLRPTQL